MIVASGPVPQTAAAVGFGSPALLRLTNRPLIAFAAQALRDAGLRRAVLVCSSRDSADIVRAARASGPWTVSLAALPHGAGPWSAPALRHAGGRLLVAVEADAVPGRTLSGAVAQVRDSALGALFVAAPDGEIVAGVLRPAALQALAAGSVPAEGSLLADACHSLETAGVPTRVTPSPDAWRWTGQAGALLDVHRRLLDELARDDARRPLTGARIQGAVFADPSVHIEDSVLRGPIVLGPRARVSGAYVGPYTAISDDVVVEGAEIEHSILLPGASIRYPGRRVEGSIVGPGAKVFRSFALPEALRVTLGPSSEVGLA